MLWYLLRTWAGREKELVQEIQRTVPSYLYQEVFVLYTERIWRRQGRSRVHPEPLFKGCVFLTCQETAPLFRRLDQIPSISRMLAAGTLSLFPMREEDVSFLQKIGGEDHMLRLSWMLREPGTERYRVSGPLEAFLPDLENIDFRKRFVKIRRNLWGEDQTLAMGILLDEDMEIKPVFEETEASAELPSEYRILEIGRDSRGKKIYRERRPMAVMAGGLEEMVRVG